MSDFADPVAAENAKLRKINAALMRRVEHSTDVSGSGFSMFQAAIALEDAVRIRTRDLHRTLQELNAANAGLRKAKEEADRARADLANAIDTVREGFALFSPDDRLVMCNLRFRSQLPGLADVITPGLSFAEYARHASENPQLELEPGAAPADWLTMRMALHGRDNVCFVQALKGDRWVQVSERATPDGGRAILQTDVTDMTRWERRERDKRLDEQARLIRATLDHMSQGVCVFDRSQALVAWNDRYRELLGLPFDLLRTGVGFLRLAKFMRQNARVASSRAAARLVRWALGEGPRQPLTVELRRADGMVLDASCRATPDGGFVVSFTDVTAERAAIAAMHSVNEVLEQRVAERTQELTAVNDQLRREIAERRAIEAELVRARDAAESASLSKTRFLAAASHDLLQPLNAARLFIATLQETTLETGQAAVVDRIDRAFGSVEDLLNRLLNISKIDAGMAEATIQPIPVARILDPIANEFTPLAARKGLRLTVRPSAATVLSDANYLRSVAQNLVGNALKYTDHGRVLVACRRRGERLALEVWDTGRGVAKADQSKIFEEFQRGESAQGAGERGMGLGLAIVERACRLLGHRLEFRSTLGRGSMFSVLMPLAETAPATETPAPEFEPFENEAEGLIALLVENDAEIRDAMGQLLQRWGVNLLSASSTEEAMAAIAQLGMAPDVLLADYHLDGDDTGLRTCQMLRERFGSAAPAILITADHSPCVAELASGAGMHLLTKPVKPARLRSLVQWVSGRSPRLPTPAARRS